MPARRDMQTGRLSFLHRSWGPLEPFDNSFPELLQRRRNLQPPDHRPFPLLGGWRGDLSQPLRLLRVHPRPGRRPLEGDGAAALGAPARDVPRAAVQRGAARLQAPQHRQPRVHQGGEGLPLRAVLPGRLRVPRSQPRRRRLAAADRDLRPARALPGAAALPRRVQDRLERPDPRLAALWPRGRTAGGMRGAAGELLCRRVASATCCWASCSTISTSTICGRTPRSSSRPTTASCSASTISGRRTG